MTTQPDTEDPVALLEELTGGQRTVMHVDQSTGTMHARQMTVIESSAGIFRFLADRTHGWASDGEVLLAFSDDDDGRWVSANGTQRLVTDRAEVERLWSPIAKGWFEGPEDPDVVVLEVSVEQFAWWDSSSSKLVRMVKLVKGTITGDADEGDHGVTEV